jgi:hypothetical protein
MSKIVLLSNVSLLDNIHRNYSNSKSKVSNSKSKVRRAAKDSLVEEIGRGLPDSRDRKVS